MYILNVRGYCYWWEKGDFFVYTPLLKSCYYEAFHTCSTYLLLCISITLCHCAVYVQ